jgi:hypothetical protein
MQTFTKLSASEVDLMIAVLRDERNSRRARQLGNKIRKSLKEYGGKAPADMELIGPDDYGMGDDDEE